MSMEITNNYSNYAANTNAVTKEKVTQSTQEYVRDLEQKYGVKITVVDFKNEKQLDSYIFGCSGGNNVAISANIAEKMASNPSYAAKYEKMIAEQPQHGKDLEKWAANNGQTIYGSGMYIDKDGNAKWWIIGGEMESRENPGTIYKEKVQKQLEQKRAERREKEALEKKHAEVADTKEKLLEKMKENAKAESLDEGAGKAVKSIEDGKGTQIDLSI